MQYDYFFNIIDIFLALHWLYSGGFSLYTKDNKKYIREKISSFGECLNCLV